MFADLHIHTCASDGTYTPQELMALARHYRFSALAITDHDTVDNCAPMAEACHLAGLEFFTGAEFTAQWLNLEVHLLGYNIDVQHPRLLNELALFQKVRHDRIEEIVARLNRLRIPLESEAVFTLANCRSPGRPHVGRALVQAGYCSSLDEAFDRFLKKHRPAWVPKYQMSVPQAIDLIHEAGGVAVLAHPGLSPIRDAVPELAAHGLDGLECFHSQHSADSAARFVALAREHGLLITGGSDCHGMNKGNPTLGSIKLPYSFIEELKTRGAVPVSI
jgi:3',5'-nucleoside bisphosphate phosphatase